MMKKLYALLSLVTFLATINVDAQTLYTNTVQTGSRFNPGLGALGTPIIIFDDVNIPAATVADADSIGFTMIKVGIRRLANAPAVTVNIYLTGADPIYPTLTFLDSFPEVPPTLLGSVSLPANGPAAVTQIISVGDSTNIIKAVARDTGNLVSDFQTVFVGVSFSTTDANASNGWRLTSGPGPNFDITWGYDVDDFAAPRTAFSLTGAVSTYYIEAFGRPMFAPLAFDARAVSITDPENLTCFTGPQTITVDVQNLGQSPIAPGAANVTLRVGGANTYTGTLSNANAIPVNGTTTITFSNVILNNAGENIDTAIVSFAGDLRSSNDTLFGGSFTVPTINNFPVLDDIEGTELTITPFIAILAGSRQLWSLHFADTAFINPDMADSLAPYSGQSFLYFDAYSGANSIGVEGRLFSNCIGLGTPAPGGSCNSSLSFFMSHDTTFLDPNFDDSLYVSVSADQGNTWNRIAGFRRLSPDYAVPGWGQEFVDLTPYNGSNIQIGFEGVSQWGNIIGVDNIEIFSDCVVPVTLSKFNIQKQSKANRLNWTTTQEINAMKFVIQQSRNGRDFVTLGEVAATGNSSIERTYSYTHNMPLSGYNYYRIKMVDRDNKSKYSQVRSVQNLGLNQIQVTPNPVAGSMKVSINAEKSELATIMITDMSGKAMFSKNFPVTAGDNDIPVNTAGLTAGSYIVRVQLNGDVQVSKFIKL
ncbi:MAG TPA: T9SS type A sorting domain-containing protein [Ferruginibacter sp.]|nr:T9SS type A sorting domain-containing protein [Ferruginibacter sp.]HPH91292.1 T9SS type A sorting domain-containing protein [Ferruginibacter sp.]